MKSANWVIVSGILLMGVGGGWLLNTFDIIPGVDWVWTAGVALIGIMVLGVGGLNKLTVVVGPFLIIASFVSILRQTERITENVEIPTLFMVVGALIVVSQLLPLPNPDFIKPHDESQSGQ